MVNRNASNAQNPLLLIKPPNHVPAHQTKDLIQIKLIANHARLIFVKLVLMILPLVKFVNKAFIFRIMLVSVDKAVQVKMVHVNIVK